MAKFNIELPESVFIRNVAGEAINWKPGETESILAQATLTGVKVLLTNVYNGGGKEATEAERLAALMKKLDSWKRGEFNVVERGESQYSAFREVFLADCIAAGLTTKAAEDTVKAKVAERLGKDTKATFANFIEASALEYAEGGEMTRDEARERLLAYYAAESDRRATERANVKVELPKIDLAKFKK